MIIDSRFKRWCPKWFAGVFLLALLIWTQAAAQVTVVTSIHPYYALVQEVAGERANVVRLLPPGASPHTFDPTPRDVAQLAEADLVVLNGGLDEWLLDLVNASGANAAVLEVISELEFEPLGGEEAHGEDEHGENESGEDEHGEDSHEGTDHNHSGVNPHVWLEPALMAEVVPMFVERLTEIDPENAETYEANGERVVSELGVLNAELQEVMEPLQGAAFVPFHDAWPYFARHFGLDLIVEIEPAPGREPSPAYIADALSQIDGSGAKAIFSEVQLPARPAEVVAESAGLTLYILDPLGGGAETESYAELMRYNVGVVQEALGDE